MNQYLENYLQIIPETQKQKLLEALKVDREFAEYSPAILELVERFEYNKITEYKDQPDTVDSETYNDLVSSVYADLHVLFNQAEILDILIYNNHLLNLSDIEEMHRELERIRAKIHALREELLSTDDTVVKLEDFTTTTRVEPYTSETAHLYTDRDGGIIRDNELAIVNINQAVCKLPEVHDAEDVLLAAQASRIAERSNTTPNLHYSTDHINDGILTTLWGEFILARRPTIATPRLIDIPGDRLSLGLILDISGSMRVNNAIADLRAAAISLINRTQDDDMVSVITFNEDVRVLQNFTSNHSAARQAISTLQAKGWTALWDAMYKGLQLIKEEYGAPALVTITDGKDNRSRHKQSDVIAKAKQQDVPIYIIGMGNVDSPALIQIASETGGAYYYTPDSQGLQALINQISDQITRPEQQEIYEYSHDPKWKGIQGGAFTTFELVLDEPKIINSLTLHPFSIKPMDIINIYAEDDINTEDRYIHRLAGIYAPTKPFKINKSHTIDFAPIAVKRIEVTIRQENYSVSTYQVREADINNQTLWDKVQHRYAAEAWTPHDQYLVNPSLIQEMVDEHTGWFEYLEQYEQDLKDWEVHEERVRIAWDQYYKQLSEYYVQFGGAGSSTHMMMLMLALLAYLIHTQSDPLSTSTTTHSKARHATYI